MKFFALTLISNALLRAEEIAQTAEARAYLPENSRPMQKIGLDWFVLPVALLVIVFFVVIG